MDNDIQDLIERMEGSGALNLSMDDEDLIIWCLKHSLKVLEKGWEEEEAIITEVKRLKEEEAINGRVNMTQKERSFLSNNYESV